MNARQSESSGKSNNQVVHRWMSVADIVALHPDAADILAQYGMHCTQCAFSGHDTLEQGAYLHQLTDDDIDNILDDLKELLEKNPFLHPLITLTKEGALHLLSTLQKHHANGPYILEMMMDDQQKFFLEPLRALPSDAFVLTHRDVPELSICIPSELFITLNKATIDMRDGRFTIDLHRPLSPQHGVCPQQSSQESQ